MSKEIYISSTPHETRLAIVENDALTEIYYERENEYTLAGSIYNGKVTRVLPGMQSSFVDIGLERDAFLYITDFMEEAGDSADFDTNGNGESSRRRDRPQRRPHTSKAPSRAPPIRRQTPAIAATATAEADRGRGRGRRDRGGNRDRQPISETPVDATIVTHPTPFVMNSPLRPTFLPKAPSRASESDLGEGAPGADGSRRWRGRRGRRRGRGPGQRDESSSAQTTGAPTDSSSAQTTGAPTDLYEAPIDPDYDDTFDIDGAAARPTGDTAPIASAYASGESAGDTQENVNRGDRNRGNDRNDRGDRNNRAGRDRNDRNRGNRGDRGGRDSRIPRGFAPRTSLYGVDNTPAYNDSPETSAEPIVLPGESLSKYRKGATNRQQPLPKPPTRTSSSPPRPSTRSPQAGTVAPLFPASRSPVTAAPKIAPTSAPSTVTAPAQTTPTRHLRSPAPTSSTNKMEPAPGETIEEQPEVLLAHHPNSAPTPISTTSPPPPRLPSNTNPPTPPPPTVSTPQHPANSARAHPSWTPRNLELLKRNYQPGPTNSPRNDLRPTREARRRLSTAEHELLRASPPTPTVDRNPTLSSPTSQLQPLHEITTLHATGDITSDIPAETTFIPSAGALVEETLDEEDYNTTLHASSIEEMDDFDEEETLEGAADLGTMLREMSIDHITGSGTGEGPREEDFDEDDLEEEHSVHDPTLGDLDLSDEVDDEDEDLDESDTEEDVIHEEFAEGGEVPSNAFDEPQVGTAVPSPGRHRDSDRGRGRRDGRRDGRRFGRSDRGDRGDRPRHTGGAGDRERSGGGRDRRGGRASMQSTNLPAISELLKPGQEILVQIAKEPIAKKGARITSHIALPGRFLVFMPTVNHTGVSRKIESDGERRRLKEILLSEKGEAAGGFIVRTAASGAS